MQVRKLSSLINISSLKAQPPARRLPGGGGLEELRDYRIKRPSSWISGHPCESVDMGADGNLSSCSNLSVSN